MRIRPVRFSKQMALKNWFVVGICTLSGSLTMVGTHLCLNSLGTYFFNYREMNTMTLAVFTIFVFILLDSLGIYGSATLKTYGRVIFNYALAKWSFTFAHEYNDHPILLARNWNINLLLFVFSAMVFLPGYKSQLHQLSKKITDRKRDYLSATTF